MTFTIKCRDCGYTAEYYPGSIKCPRCNSQWREAEYDYSAVAGNFIQQASARPFDLWRYRELLPIRNPIPTLKLGEGGTPL
ncbi:MAG TPA: hypothetical protein VIV15_07395, partial [Anaerolineales bacterium]